MRRPLCCFFMAFAGGILLRFCLGKHGEELPVFFTGVLLFSGAAAVSGGAARFASITSGKVPMFGAAGILLTAAAAGFFYFHLTETVHDPLEGYAGQIITAEGRVLSVQEKEGYAKIELQRTKGILGAEGEAQQVFSGREKMLLHLTGAPEELYFKGFESGAETWQALCGKDIRITGELSLPVGRQNPGCFDYKNYLKARDIRTILSGVRAHLEIIGEGSRFWNETARIRYTFSQYLQPFSGENSRAFIMGMMFGDRSLLDEGLYEEFQRNGTAPVLAVSGLHVGIVYGCVNCFFQGKRRTRSSKRPRLILLLRILPGAAVLFLYGALASFSPSVTRALFMIYLHMGSKLLYRRYDLVTAASAAALFLLLRNPWNLFHCGFQLSFLAVFCLGFMLPRLDSWLAGCRNFEMAGSEKTFLFRFFPGNAAILRKLLEPAKWKPVIRSLFRVFLPALAIQMGMFPATAFLFNYISPLSFLINLPVTLLAGLILPAGLVLLCLTELLRLGIVFPGLLQIAAALGGTGLEILTETLLWINHLYYRENLTVFLTVSPSPFLLGAYYGALFFYFSDTAWLARKTGRRQRLILFMAAVLLGSAFLPAALNSREGQAELIFVSVGQGDCLHIRTPGGKNVLIDGGGTSNCNVGKRTLLPYLLKNGVSQIDLALLSHLHEDHYLGICQLAEDMEIRQIGLYEGNRCLESEVLRQTGAEAWQLLYLSAGQRISLEPGIWIDVLWPRKEEAQQEEEPDDANETGLLLKLCYYGISVLMTGDLGKDEEAEILEWLKESGTFPGGTEVLRSDILKVGHHGSRNSTSDEFLAAVQPRIAVIQSGAGNRFGHPHRETVENLEKHGILIYRNDTQGAVLADIDPDGALRLRTMFMQERIRKKHGGNQRQKKYTRISEI